MASNLRRSKRTVGRRILDLQTKVSGLQKRVGPISIGQNAVSTSSLQPGAVGGWVVDANSIYTGVKTATGFFAPSSSITIGSDGHITANKFRIDANGNAFFTGSITGATGTFSGSLSGATITGGTIDIGGFDTSSFHVDASGNMWLGASTYDSAPFRVSAAGVLRSRSVTGSDVYTTTLTNAAYRNEFFSASDNAYAVFTIGSTVLNHTGYFPGTGNLLDTSIRERVVYQTDGIYMDARRALGTTYTDGIVFLGTQKVDTPGQQRTIGRLILETKNDSNTVVSTVDILDGSVTADLALFEGGFPRDGNNTGFWGSVPPTFAAWGLVASYNFFNPSDGRFKDNQKELPLGLSFINKLQPIEYTNLAPRVVKAKVAREGEEQEEDVFEWDIGSRLRAGFTAQNVKEALIAEGVGDYNLWSMADKNDPDSYQMLDYTQLIAPVVQAIKEIVERLENLESRS